MDKLVPHWRQASRWTCAAPTTACASSGWARKDSSAGCDRSSTGVICLEERSRNEECHPERAKRPKDLPRSFASLRMTEGRSSGSMLTELRVRDLATISDVTLQLGPGLNVLTGETGAGKSMLVDALALLLGERATGGSVRPGAAKTIVEGVFEGVDKPTRQRIESLGLDVEDGRVIVRREVSGEGRSRAWVNGSPTTAAVLAQLGAFLVDLHGQHDTQSLLHADAQRDILDAFAHAEAERDAVIEAHRV